jgi:uncharacterized protein YggT (Ycf19 family)
MFKRYIFTVSDLIIGLIEFLLTLRLLLKLLGASASAPFVQWIYATTSPLLAPFEGMFPTSTLPVGFILEVSTLFALISYAFLGVLIESVLTQLTLPAHRHD